MKRKLLLTAAIIISSVVMLNAQCTPGNYTMPGIYPDSAQNLPTCYVNYPYDAVITAVIPTDTVYLGYQIAIDSIGVDSILGFPTGFSYATNSPTNYWHGGVTGCAAITGTATHAQIGTYNLRVSLTAHAGGLLAVPEKMLFYKIVIKDSVAGIADYNNNNFVLFQNSPNPFATTTNIQFSSKQPDAFQFTVYDVIGNIVYNKAINATAGLNNFDFSSGSLSSGMYFYKLSNTKDSYTRRMIVANK